MQGAPALASARWSQPRRRSSSAALRVYISDRARLRICSAQ